MNIALLNIPFAIVGIAIAIVPLIIGMKYTARSNRTETTTTTSLCAIQTREEEFEHAA